jgi:hypothetical protein
MSHDAGYFRLSYQWDHHCHVLFHALKGRFRHMLRELGELYHEHPFDTESVLNYYRKWHYNREHFHLTVNEINRRQFVIDSLGYRGYGVNRDLHRSMEALKNEYAGRIHCMISELFYKEIFQANENVGIPQERIDQMDSNYLIGELCRKLGRNPEENIPSPYHSARPELGNYFRIMSENTSWSANTAIFRKLFLNPGCSSTTLMKGSMGYQNFLPSREMKVIGNRNFTELYEQMFSRLNNFTDIGMDLLKQIQFVLARGIDPDAGNFRNYDFSDRNGVTLDFGNFQREIADLEHLLHETAQSFHDLDSFIWNLSRSYYMFLGIHPFGDSNGRTIRCFLNFMLIKKGLPPISFIDEKEVFCYAQYGGSMEDMHEYIKTRIQRAVDRYFFERRKLERSGFLSSKIHNVSFDSGFHFRQIGDRPVRIQVNFQAFVIDDLNPLSIQYQDKCMVVLPDEQSVMNMTIYCGFSDSQGDEWGEIFELRKQFSITEIKSDLNAVRVFDIDFVIEIPADHIPYNYFNCSVASPETGRIFNNRGLNYSYRLED